LPEKCPLCATVALSVFETATQTASPSEKGLDMKRIAIAILVGAAGLTALTACSSTTAGNGQAALAATTSKTPTASAKPSTSTSASTHTPATTQAPAPVSAPTATVTHSVTAPTTTSAPVTTATTSTVAASSSPPVAAQITNVSWTVSCTSHTDAAGKATITWTSLGATEVWVLPGSTASTLVYADAKADGGTGPLAKNGSVTLRFPCAEDYSYYLIDAYNATGHSGQVQQVPYA
jgi:hypothetical protein